MSGKSEVYRDKKGTKTSKGYSRRSNISKKRPLNRYEMESPRFESASTSAKKLKLSKDSYRVKVNKEFGYRLLNFVAVFSAISEVVVCKTCKSKVKFVESGQRGLGFKIVISCENCQETAIPNCPFIDKAYEVNCRIILAMRLLGIGLNGIEKFCAFMDLPRPIFHSFYKNVIHTIAQATETVCQQSMKKAAQEEKVKSVENKRNCITVSGNGTWRKRGFSSLYGLVSLIGWHTGKIIDKIVKSKYCRTCEFWSKKKTDTIEYIEWSEIHAPQCQVNHEGSSGKMEVDAVVELFQRSETLHSIKYANYIGDGDSNTFKGILDVQPYKNFIVKKKECIDYVQKQFRTRLHNLKKTNKDLDGKGKLTGKLIDKLSIYYGLAIRRNPDSIEKMGNEIWATLYHKLSTDDKPRHEKCPSDEDSWCSWQKAKATNTLNEYSHKPALPQNIFDAIRPIYEEFSTDDLLSRCIGGFTQSSDESFNSVVWSIVPKTVSSGEVIVDIAATIAVCIFNDGMGSVLKIMDVLGMTIGPNFSNFCAQADARRIKFSKRSLPTAIKKARLSLKSARKEEQDINIEGQLYGAGIAD